ncbi:MAG: type II toxin-antitoxin system VapC family toxin [Candidatus Lambdaproteobacteria bacterium]|nr:type II toxin-antitoxin system VapC family toxin [Candidatus Lambdaproteobacteria bacterium]
MVVCDTHVLIYDALEPARLSRRAARSIDSAEKAQRLACADISLWEIAMLMAKGRLAVDAAPEELLQAILSARQVRVLPITPAIAALACSPRFDHGNPADRLIAATAVVHRGMLLTKDKHLGKVPGLTTIW